MSRSNNTNNGTDMKTFTRLAGLTAGLVLGGSAGAVELNLGDVSVAMTNKASIGAQVRVEGRNPQLVGIANGGEAFSTNGDDGNLAWDAGEVTSAAAKLTSDLSVNWGEFGLFVRGSAFINPVLDGADLFDPNDYGAGREQPISELEAKEDDIRGHVGNDADLLDAYVFGRFDVFERALNIKVGRQVLNWGESAFVQHGLNALISADVNQLRVPGFEIEEIQTPVGMALISLDLIENVGIEGFYQYEWQKTIIDVPGTLMSTNDFAGIGGTQANLGFGRADENQPASSNTNPATWCDPPPSLIPGFGSPCIPFGSTVPRAPDREPSDGDQFGGKLNFFVPWLNNMDLALYGAKYHSRLPLVSGTSRSGPTTSADDANYFLEYPEDIQIYGTSFNTTVPWIDVALQGEYSMKVDQPLQVDDVEILLAGLGAPGQVSPLAGGTLGHQYLRGWRRHDVSQVDLSFTKIFGPLRWLAYDQLSLFVEGGFVHVHDLPPPDVLAYDAPATSTLNPGTAALNPSTAFGLPITPYSAYATTSSWGYKSAARFTYNNVFGVFTVEPTFLFQHDVNGVTPTPIVNFVEGRRQLNSILSVNYLQAWNFDLGYAMFFGGGPQNLINDRDYVDFAIKYSF
jgi:hypothetical protein